MRLVSSAFPPPFSEKSAVRPCRRPSPNVVMDGKLMDNLGVSGASCQVERQSHTKRESGPPIFGSTSSLNLLVRVLNMSRQFNGIARIAALFGVRIRRAVLISYEGVKNRKKLITVYDSFCFRQSCSFCLYLRRKASLYITTG
jgi:hypothetical protein